MAMEKISVGVILAIAMTGIVVSVLASSLLMAYQRLPSTGNVKVIGVCVYWEDNCTSNVTSIDWGLLEPGEATNITVYIRNEGNIPVVLNMTTEKWDPTLASKAMNLSWNSENYALAPGAVVQAVLTLSVSPNIYEVKTFRFDIIITGRELQA